MRRKRLGRTGLTVPIVGVGTAFLGYVPAAAWQDAGDVVIDEAVAARTLSAALDGGAEFVDTAPLYGDTRVESVIGAVRAQRASSADSLILSTKAGRTSDGHDYSRDGIRRSVEDSLTRLKVDRVDIVSVHDSVEYYDQVMGPEGALQGLTELREEGVIGAVGVGCFDPTETARYVETGSFDVAIVANAWSIVNRTLEERILPAAIRFDVGLVIGTPLERGLLAVGVKGGRRQGGREHSDDVLALVERVETLCAAFSIPLLAVSLQWSTRHPQIASAIPGPRIPEEASANAFAASIEIPEEFWSEFDAIVEPAPTVGGRQS